MFGGGGDQSEKPDWDIEEGLQRFCSGNLPFIICEVGGG